MRSTAAFWVVVMGLALPAAAETISVELKHRAYRDWAIDLPAERWFPVSGGIAIPHAGGEAFAATLEGADLRVDTDGDGAVDRTIRATADDLGVRRSRLVLRGEHPGGASLSYGVRLVDAGAGWAWAPGGAMVGAIRGDDGSATPIRIIDRNGNGRWNDVGEDAMIIGRGSAACFLSETVTVGDRLWSMEVSGDGSGLRLEPYAGPTGRLDMTTGFSASARLVSAVVRSDDGRHSFDLARYDEPIDVPAGKYEIVAGRIGLGAQSVAVSAGRAEAIVLGEGDATTFDWGGPVAAEFQYRRRGDEVVFSPDAIWFYGTAGEQYHDWSPKGKSPEFTVRNKEDGAVLEVLILPGSC